MSNMTRTIEKNLRIFVILNDKFEFEVSIPELSILKLILFVFKIDSKLEI